ncbi:DUF6457 domain-containing protein [Cutibacterium acnes]|uniref:DUF6457 domain-containing protein n=1 Tax=Cutibacterium acnes TaxID=1747 RepID=UPI0001EF40CC|nr:DUF6457 domain-containing protein [Cutibacterium acnes]EFS40963.1 hypothetical protein HMPREF9575_00988 [Cutibacterium acnes HL110PA1]
MTTLRSEEVAMSHHDDNPEKMARMRDWLEIAAREVDVDPSVLTDVEQPLLDMVSVISPGPSRPGAPLTAFLVGIATAQGGDTLQLVKKLMQAAEQRGQTRD